MPSNADPRDGISVTEIGAGSQGGGSIPKDCAPLLPIFFDQWHCRICADRFLYSEMVRKHIADKHDQNMPPSMYEYFRGAVWLP